MDNKELLICQCHNTEHQMIFLYDNEDNDATVYVHIHLNKYDFWHRLKHGIKYIFGHQSRFGAFDEFIMNPKDANKLEKVVEYLKSDNCKLNGVVKCEDDCDIEANLEIN